MNDCHIINVNFKSFKKKKIQFFGFFSYKKINKLNAVRNYLSNRFCLDDSVPFFSNSQKCTFI